MAPPTASQADVSPDVIGHPLTSADLYLLPLPEDDARPPRRGLCEIFSSPADKSAVPPPPSDSLPGRDSLCAATTTTEQANPARQQVHIAVAEPVKSPRPRSKPPPPPSRPPPGRHSLLARAKEKAGTDPQHGKNYGHKRVEEYDCGCETCKEKGAQKGHGMAHYCTYCETWVHGGSQKAWQSHISTEDHVQKARLSRHGEGVAAGWLIAGRETLGLSRDSPDM
jgi:hypothetical protein